MAAWLLGGMASVRVGDGGNAGCEHFDILNLKTPRNGCNDATVENIYFDLVLVLGSGSSVHRIGRTSGLYV